MNQDSDATNQLIPLEDALAAVQSSTTKFTGIIIGAIEQIYGRDARFLHIRSVVTSALGDRGMRGHLVKTLLDRLTDQAEWQGGSHE